MDFTGIMTQAMEFRGVSLTDLSGKTGINYEQLRRYKVGENKPSFENAVLIIKSLGYQIDIHAVNTISI